MGDNNNGWSFLDTRTVFSVLLQMMGYQSDQKQASNDDILRELQRQNMDYLEKIGVLRVHAAAVLDGQGLGGVLAVQLADDLADSGADLLGLISGSSLAGADGPDGLVGDDNILQLVSGHAIQRDLDLHTDQLLGHALLTLVEALADADDGLQAAGQRSLGALVDGLVGLGKVLAALAVADDDILNAEVGQHIGRDLAGESTRLLEVDILGADMDVGALGHLDSGDEIGEGNADDDLAAGVLDSGDQLADEGLGLGSGLVHFPVAGDDSFTILFIHDSYSFLK